MPAIVGQSAPMQPGGAGDDWPGGYPLGAMFYAEGSFSAFHCGAATTGPKGGEDSPGRCLCRPRDRANPRIRRVRTAMLQYRRDPIEENLTTVVGPEA